MTCVTRLSTRRGAAIGFALAALALIGAVATTAGQGARATQRYTRPNIVFVLTDDQAMTQMSSEVMPRVNDLLGDQGTRFDHAYLTTPLCCPSRATLLTGQYGHNNGVLRNAYGLLNDKGNVLPVWLRQAGYVTAHVGKFLNVFHRGGDATAVAPGWSEWHTLLWKFEENYYGYDLSVNGHRVHHGFRFRDYSPQVFERTTKRLIQKYVPRDRPLYLELDEVTPHAAPHKGVLDRCNPIPDDRDRGMFGDARLPRPPSFNEDDMDDKPSFMHDLPRLNDDEIAAMTRRYRCGLAALQAVDRTVGKVYRQIDRLGELHQTVFIFMTDNGVFNGEHRLSGGKLFPYEEGASTPLIMRVPARYLGGKQAVSHVTDPVANIDVAPTILSLAHARPCTPAGRCRVMDGRSLKGLMAGFAPPWAADRPIGLELNLSRAKPDKPVCHYTGVRASDQVLIKHLEASGPSSGKCVPVNEWERYDLTKDPYELHNQCFGGNLASCPAGEAQQRLRTLLKQVEDCAGIPGRDPRPRNGHYCG